MPLGRVYQAPTTVPRNTPVFGCNGIKSVSNTDLVITGQAVRSKKSSKSPSQSPPVRPSFSLHPLSSASLQSSKSASISPSRQSGPRKSKSPSPGLRKTKQTTNITPKPVKRSSLKGKETAVKKEDTANNNINGNTTVNIDVKPETNSVITKEKSWSPEVEEENQTTVVNENNVKTETPKGSLESIHNDNNDGKTSSVSGQTNGFEKAESPVKESSPTLGGTSGLRNIGNTCFMNSVIQCLSNTKQLTNYLLNDEHMREINTTNSSMKGSLIKAFATVIKALWKGNGRVVDPSSLKGAVNRFAPRFSGYNQEDSQEFLRYLLEGLHEDVNRVLTKPTPINTEIDSSLSVCEQAMEAWKRYIRRDDSHLVDLFVGQLKSTLRCSDCSHESVTFEPFWDLSLGIPSRSGEVSLTDCLDSFTKEEVLDGDEMPTCEKCKARRRCTKRYSLYRLPKILVVHLKRFSQSDRFKQKLSSTVTFPLTGLSLSRYTDSVSSSTYSCYAVSNHSGTLYSGHYTAFAKHPQSGQWYSYNDSRVSKCSSSTVITSEAYLLFFELS